MARLTRLGSRFGIAKMVPSASTARMRTTCHRAKYIMSKGRPPFLWRPSAGVALLVGGIVLQLRGLGAIDHVADGGTQDAHAHALGDLELDLVVVDHLGDGAEDAADGHNA